MMVAIRPMRRKSQRQGVERVAEAQVGVIGLAVMGKNLALNIESRGFTVAVYNRTPSRTQELAEEAKDKRIVPAYALEDFVASLERPGA